MHGREEVNETEQRLLLLPTQPQERRLKRMVMFKFTLRIHQDV